MFYFFVIGTRYFWSPQFKISQCETAFCLTNNKAKKIFAQCIYAHNCNFGLITDITIIDHLSAMLLIIRKV